ncbi:hypothetical protein R3P38DRAFT_3191448 [Favolaschia claudopus]|uniref:Uncharacterized protein n=1 Tax=Favolaschia claudopus TaxID=2862362 RepID=A0AAW0BKT9_9AGAR
MSTDANTSAYRIEHLRGEDNYQTWAGRIVKPIADANAISSWERKDRQALSAIRLRVADGPLVYISGATDSRHCYRPSSP